MSQATPATPTAPVVIKPPFTWESAAAKVRMAEDAWNTRDPQRVSLAYTEDSVWRNRAEFLHGRAEVQAFLRRKWSGELDYRLIKGMWAVGGQLVAVRRGDACDGGAGHELRSVC